MTNNESWLSEFHQNEDLIYLNHAAVAPWPKRTCVAVTEFAKQNFNQGATAYKSWLAVEKQLREQLCVLVNAPSPDDIALLKNTSEGLSFVAAGLDWEPGDNIVISDEEFPSNRIVWESLRPQGVEVRRVALIGPNTPEAALQAACDKRTRLVSISSVQFASGLRINVDELGEACSKRNILFCIDAIQSLGAFPLDVQRCRADFVVADAHKWLLGPEGIALFYVGAKVRDRLKLTEFGWHMVEDHGNYDRLDWEPARSARRFECGSPNMLGIHAFHASTSLLLETGMKTISERILENTDMLIDAISRQQALRIDRHIPPARRSGIVAFEAPAIGSTELAERLRNVGVICVARAGKVRFSPHFYIGPAALQAAVARTAKCLELSESK